MICFVYDIETPNGRHVAAFKKRQECDLAMGDMMVFLGVQNVEVHLSGEVDAADIEDAVQAVATGAIRLWGENK